MKAPFHSRDLASRNKKAGGEFLGEEQTASDTLNWEFCRLHGGSETVCEGAERRAKQVRSVLQDTGHLQGDGHCSATLRPPLGHPSATPQLPLGPQSGWERAARAKPKAFLSALQIAESISRTNSSIFIYLFIHQGGEEVESQPF